MILYLLRHATASREAATDAERKLTKEGRREAQAAGKALRRLGARPAWIWSSPLVRACQTAEIAAEALGDSAEVQIKEELENGKSTQEILALLKPLPADSEVVLVGHMPSLSEHLAALVGANQPGNLPLDKGGVACLRLDDLRPGKGELRFRLRNEQLERIA
ncbi:MAG: phosphohistidine phosphatase SixA [Methylacidiphilaceae bacterium]|nr:phosphohistidine phosphatase SixA [Candidatus Methylacidiphilaceae bacterium]